jgi:hypothetical protein
VLFSWVEHVQFLNPFFPVLPKEGVPQMLRVFMTMFCQVVCFPLFSVELASFSALFVQLCHNFFFLQYMCHIFLALFNFLLSFSPQTGKVVKMFWIFHSVSS